MKFITYISFIHCMKFIIYIRFIHCMKFISYISFMHCIKFIIYISYIARVKISQTAHDGGVSPAPRGGSSIALWRCSQQKTLLSLKALSSV